MDIRLDFNLGWLHANSEVDTDRMIMVVDLADVEDDELLAKLLPGEWVTKTYHKIGKPAFDYEERHYIINGEPTLELPCHYEVCPVCQGRGKHVNPSIDSHGISEQEFAEDPGFAEAYWRGDYDQTCNCCRGRTTVAMVDRGRANKHLLAYADEMDREEAEYAAQCRSERRWDC